MKTIRRLGTPLPGLTRKEPTMNITPEMTVKEAILRYPKAMEVFDVHRLVMCCNADVSIARAAERYGKDRAVLLRMLNQVAAG